MLTTKSTVLIVEDDPLLQEVLSVFLKGQGYDILIENHGGEAVETILSVQPDAVILDLLIPGVNGFEVCQRVRPRFQGAILILTGCDEENDHIRGLEVGADDYVTKPVTPLVLLARLRALLRRIENAGLVNGKLPTPPPFNGEPFVLGELTIIPGARMARIGQGNVDLTTLEYELLVLLAQRAGATVEREDLYQELLDREYDGLDRTIDVHISRLRKKLVECGGSADWIKTIHGRGYQLIVQAG